MKVVVTGGSGLAGRAVVSHLVAHGHEVTNADIVPSAGAAPFRRVDMNDLGQVYGVVSGADAVIHLAAIPRPTLDVPEVVFRTNTMATYNVLEASSALGVPRVVYASSVSVIGFPFFQRPVPPEYVPIDEAHPRLPQDAYALSKYVGEELAAGFARRGQLSVVSLRFAWIHTPETFAAEVAPLQANPVAGASNMWAYIDSRDLAESFRLALAAEVDGHDACFVAAADTFMPIPSRQLVEEFYPSTVMRDGFGEYDALVSSAKAERLLGFRPAHSWRWYQNDDDSG